MYFSVLTNTVGSSSVRYLGPEKRQVTQSQAAVRIALDRHFVVTTAIVPVEASSILQMSRVFSNCTLLDNKISLPAAILY